MLANIFIKVLRMSLTASFVIGVVLLVRFLLRRSPKVFSYALWAVVLLRLLCPVSFSAPVSLIPREFNAAVSETQWEAPKPEKELSDTSDPAIPGPAAEYPAVAQTDAGQTSGMTALCCAWLVGVAAIWLYSAYSYVRLRRSLSDAVPLRDNIYISDHIPSPCVAGLLRQRIYLPPTLLAEEQLYIIAHEQHHIRRGDPLVRFLAFAALTIHWFNPLVWLSFHLLVKDMEMSCDEAVLRKLGPDIRSDYSQSLLNLAAGHPQVAWTPLTFSETETSDRIRNILRWRKPAAWAVVLPLVLSVTVSVCALTDPAAETPEEQPADPAENIQILQIDDDVNVITLNEKQLRVLERHLENTALAEVAEDPHGDIHNLFAVEIQPYTLSYGCSQGKSYVILEQPETDTARIVEDETLKWYLYHFYICNGAIDMDFTELPEDAVLRSSSHAKSCAVQLYDYYCDLCGQEETAVVSYYCGCGKCNAFWREEARNIQSTK